VTQCTRRQGGRLLTLVFPDADLDAAAAAITEGGPCAVQTRVAGTSHVLAHESVQTALAERLADRVSDWEHGDLFDEVTTVAPLRDGTQAERLASRLDDALSKGANQIRGGDTDERTVEPTVLTDVPSDAALLDAPEYGPVVPVTPFDDEERARRLAADLGPASAVRVFTDRHSLAMRVADVADAGRISIHGTTDELAAGVDRDTSDGVYQHVTERDIARLTRTKRVVHR
jgi:glyceraldehyde-3-phosphate dehydrogenase [NAD(P)+]